jgi:hypothetical protein
MIEKMIEESRNYLPLKISEVEWDGTVFQIYSSSWSFTTLSVWRVVTSDKVVFACFDDDSDRVKQLKGLEVVGLEIQESILKVDPVFLLSNGQRLEIFSTDTYESWTFGIDGCDFAIGTPRDPNAFDKNN